MATFVLSLILLLSVQSDADESSANCTVAPFNSYVYCDQTLPTHTRVNDLVSRMTLTEKVTNLQNNNPGVPRLGVPANAFHEALHGVVCDCGETYQGNTGCATSFPHALLLGATFNRSLWKSVASAISTEARAFANQGITGLFYWAPDINLFRDPRWGRGQEVPGEDPFLTGQYVAQFGYHMQHGEDSKYLKVVSTAKHFADYDLEGTWGINRGNFSANVSMQEQVEYYWPAFRSAIQTAKIQSIMCSYNAVNGMPMCGNDYFMNEIARKQWGFDGFFVSDCGAISDAAFQRYINETFAESNSTMRQFQQVKQALVSGCDAECGDWYALYLEDAVKAGVVSEDDIDTASKRLWSKTIELGVLDFDPPSFYTTYGADKIDSPEHRSLALHAAEQGIVLLKNDANILPLSDAKKKIALLGPHANATNDLISIYKGENIIVDSQSPYQQFVAYAQDEITYALGCDYLCNNTSGFESAIASARDADIAIVFLGLHPLGHGCSDDPNGGAACEDEGFDRNTIDLPANQTLLLQKVFAVNKNTILVLINGGAVNITWAKQNVAGIVEAFYPGEYGGQAIRNIMYGRSAPAAKLPVTVYDGSLMRSRPSIADMGLRSNGGITYRYYTGTPLYPFGYGLYYTKFTYKYYDIGYDDQNGVRNMDTQLLADFYGNDQSVYKSDVAGFIVEVSNIGDVSSDCVVLGFVSSGNDDDAPLLKLFDFQRVYIERGQSVNVTLSVSPEAISVTNKHGNERIVNGKYSLYLGDYPTGNHVERTLNLVGPTLSIFEAPDQQYQAL